MIFLYGAGRYELISGHRRKRACELAGFETLRCEVFELTRDKAIILMVESNYQRTQQLPSQRAFAYKMRLEAMARQGKRSDLTCATELHKSDGKKSRDSLSYKGAHSVYTEYRFDIRGEEANVLGFLVHGKTTLDMDETYRHPAVVALLQSLKNE